MADAYSQISGGWLGTYRYLGLIPIRFEATFAVHENELRGEIIDEIFPGLAKVEGGQRGSGVFFSKTYVARLPQNRVSELQYEGCLSEDGLTLRGTWRGKARTAFFKWFPVSGDWEARRMWAENQNHTINSESRGEYRQPAVAKPDA